MQLEARLVHGVCAQRAQSAAGSATAGKRGMSALLVLGHTGTEARLLSQEPGMAVAASSLGTCHHGKNLLDEGHEVGLVELGGELALSEHVQHLQQQVEARVCDVALLQARRSRVL